MRNSIQSNVGPRKGILVLKLQHNLISTLAKNLDSPVEVLVLERVLALLAEEVERQCRVAHVVLGRAVLQHDMIHYIRCHGIH